jgi:hypothetical protein
MASGTVHLDFRGSDDWNGPRRSSKLQHDTWKHAMRIHEGEWWTYGDWPDKAIIREGKTPVNYSVKIHSHDWAKWTDAPTFLGWMRDAYLSAAWSPWATSNRDGQWGIQPSHITSAL